MSTIELPEYLTPETMQAVRRSNQEQADLRAMALLDLDPEDLPPPTVELAPTAPDDEAIPEDTLGARMVTTRAQRDAAAIEAKRKLETEALTTRTLDPELEQQRADEAFERIRNNDITIDGDVVGDFMRSNTILRLDGGYIRDPETGDVRKGSPLELWINNFGRQTLYEGPEEEKRMAELNAMRKEKYDDAIAAGASPTEALEELESVFDNWLTFRSNRGIVETRLQQFMRSVLGSTEAAVGEFVFDELPLFYEVDDKGEMQNPDDLADIAAYTLDQARGKIASATGLSRDTVDDAFGSALLGPSAGTALSTMQRTSLLPRPFQPIDRDSPTGLPESALRTAAHTGSVMGDMAMAATRGRGLQDELNSIPYYREQLGDYQSLSLIPAIGLGIAIPITPIPIAGGVIKGGVAGAKATARVAPTVGKYLDEAADAVLSGMDAASKITSPTRWRGAYDVHRELSLLVDDVGGADLPMPSMLDLVLDRGEPAKRIGAIFEGEITTPYKMQAVLRDDAPLTYDHLIGLADTSRSGRHILKRIEGDGVIPIEEQLLSDAADVGRRNLDDEVSLADRAAIQQGIDEWRVGLEAQAVESALLRAADEGKSLASALETVIQDTAGTYIPRLYRPVVELAEQTDNVKRVMREFRSAARTAGSAPIRSTNKRMRMVLDLASESSRVGAKQGLRTVSALQPLFRVPKKLADAPAGVQYASALSRATRRTFEDMVRGHVPSDMRFVTDRLMMNRARVTPKLMKQVGEAERAVFGTKAVGDGTFELTKGTPESVMQMVRDVVPRHADIGDVQRAVESGQWDTTMQEFLTDAVREAQFRRIVPDDMVREAVFETAEVAQARRPNLPGTLEARKNFTQQVLHPIMDTIMAGRAAAVETTRAVANALPASRGQAALVGALRRSDARYDARRFQRWFQGGSSTMPSAVETAKAKIANIVGVIASRHREEMLQRTRAAAAEGASNPAALANTEASIARWATLGDNAVSKFRETVRRERQMQMLANQDEPTRRVPTYAETVMMVLYRDNQARVVNLGRVLEKIRNMDSARQDQLVDMAEELVKQGVYRQEWQELMQRFFLTDSRIARFFKLTDQNETLAGKLKALTERAMYTNQDALGPLDALLAADREAVDHRDILNVLKQLSVQPVRVPDQANLEAVVNFIRKEAPDSFSRRGAARLKVTGYEDAIDDAVQAWQISADKRNAINPVWDDLFRRNPELRFDLAPTAGPQTKFAQTASLMKFHAPVSVAVSVLQRLRTELELAGMYDANMERQFKEAMEFVRFPIEASPTGAEVPRPASRQKNNFLDPLMEWARLRTRNMGPTELQKMGEQAVSHMSRSGSLYPDYAGGGIIQAGESKGNTFGLFQALDRVVTARRIPGQSDLTDANAFMGEAMSRLAGVMDEGQLKTRLYTSALAGMEEAVAPYIYNQARRVMQRWGFSSYATKGALDDTIMQIKSLPVDDLALFPVTPGFDSVLRELHESAVRGSLVNTLENLQARSLKESGSLAGYSAFALQSVLDALAYGRQMASYGLLSSGIFAISGIPIPGVPLTRYLGLNLLTAPFMMIGTLGFNGAVRGLGEAAKIGAAEAVPALTQKLADVVRTDFTRKLADKSRALVNTVAPRKPDDVLFADMYGKKWTVQEFEDLCSTYNVMMTRGDVDQAADLLATLRRDMDPYMQTGKLDLGMPAGMRKMVNKSIGKARGVRDMFFNPSLSSFSMQLATYTDGVFRRGVFASAIRDGMNPLQAAELARASVLDYGAVPEAVKQTANRYLLFASFRMASMREILMAVARGGTGYLRVMRAQMRMHQNAGTWTYGSDYDRVRLYTMAGPTFDRQQSAIGGPQDVFSTGAVDLVDLSFFMAEVLAGEAEDPTGRITQALLDEQIQPMLQAVIAGVTQQRPSRKGRLVPDVSVVYWMNNGDWEWAQERYNLTEIGSPLTKEQRRPGAPEFDVRNGRGVQYEFVGNGYRTFLMDQFIAVQLMSKRANDDYTKMMIAAGYGPDGYDPKYRVNAPFLMLLTGAGTPTRVTDPDTQLNRGFRRDAVRR